MESDGPYRIREAFNYGVVGPGIPNTEEKYDLTPDIANMIYAEGRKSMEKELEELYKIASELCIERNNLYGFETDGILDFAAYKKLRGIE